MEIGGRPAATMIATLASAATLTMSAAACLVAGSPWVALGLFAVGAPTLSWLHRSGAAVSASAALAGLALLTVLLVAATRTQVPPPRWDGHVPSSAAAAAQLAETQFGVLDVQVHGRTVTVVDMESGVCVRTRLGAERWNLCN
jgi:hypothetical protein